MRFFACPTLLVIGEPGYLPLLAEASAALFRCLPTLPRASNVVPPTVASATGTVAISPSLLSCPTGRYAVVVNLDGESYVRDHHAAADTLHRAITGTRQAIHGPRHQVGSFGE